MGPHDDAVVGRRRVAGPTALGWWMHPAVAEAVRGSRCETDEQSRQPSGVGGGVRGRPVTRAGRSCPHGVSRLFYSASLPTGMFGGGGGGLNPRKMKQMMEQMGIDMEDIDAEEVIIRTPDEELVFTDAEVQLMAAQGQKTYQVVGEPESRERGEGGSDDSATEESGDDNVVDADDVEIVAMRTGVDEDTAREALEDNDGDLADAVDQLE